jgi:hypothetical protein
MEHQKLSRNSDGSYNMSKMQEQEVIIPIGAFPGKLQEGCQSGIEL